MSTINPLAPVSPGSRRGEAYAGRMIPNSIGYDPASFSGRDPLREERTGRRIYISGRKIGTDGRVIADGRETTKALLAPREVPLAQGQPQVSPMAPRSAPMSRREKFSMDMEAQNQAMLRADAKLAEQRKQVGSTPPGMVPTMIPAAGPVRPGIDKQPMQPGYRNAARLINGKPADEVNGTQQSGQAMINGLPAETAINQQKRDMEAKPSPLAPVSTPASQRLTQAAVTNAITQPASPVVSMQAKEAGKMEGEASIAKLGPYKAAEQQLAKLNARKGPLQPVASR